MTEAVLEKVDWRAQAKELGIRMYRRTKVDVLADIKAARMGTLPSVKDLCVKCGCHHEPTLTCEPPIATIETVEVPPTEIEPVPEHPPWEDDGKLTEVEPLMRRIETLENRVNRIVEAISKSKKVKGL